MFLFSTISILFLFFLSILAPFLSFNLPFYMIKKVNVLENKKKNIIEFLVAVVLVLTNYRLLILYIVFPKSIERLYYFFQKNYQGMKKFDKIIISSFITFTGTFIFIYFTRNIYATYLDSFLAMYEGVKADIPIERIKELLDEIKNNYIYMIFEYAFIGTLFTYFAIDNRDYEEWKISYLWIIPLTVFMFMVYILKIDNVILLNVNRIFSSIFIWYGIKSLYSQLKIRQTLLRHILVILFGIRFPIATLVLGAVFSFGYLDNKKLDGGKKWQK